jgi:transposase
VWAQIWVGCARPQSRTTSSSRWSPSARPDWSSLYGVGPDTAALLLIAAGDRPERLRSEAAWAHMCTVAPIPAASGKTRRHRLNPAGAMTRLSP